MTGDFIESEEETGHVLTKIVAIMLVITERNGPRGRRKIAT